tara:strand:- start:205 stop:1095 length:891 start_codon:yes stop_codon:yes gene_type:complete
MIRKPSVSIIMNCLNGEEYLEDSLKSIVNQSYKNWELIFWDNRSTDNSADILKSFKDKRIRYFYAKKKTVLYHARNLAIKKARGKFIAFLDVDDFWEKNKLALQIPKFQNKKVGLVYSNFYKFYNKNKVKIAYKNELPSGKVTHKIVKNYQIGFLTVVIRKSYMNKNRLFDYKYDLLSDYDYILNFSLKNNFIGLNKPLANYRIHQKQLQKTKMVLQAQQFCNWVEKKNIKNKFKKYDLSSILNKYNYCNLIKELDKSKVKLFLRCFKKFNFINFLKINALIFFPKKIIFKYIDNI